MRTTRARCGRVARSSSPGTKTPQLRMASIQQVTNVGSWGPAGGETLRPEKPATALPSPVVFAERINTARASVLTRCGGSARTPAAESSPERNRDLQGFFLAVAARGLPEARRRSAWFSRKLLLRARGRIRKVRGTYRYQLTETGQKAIAGHTSALRTALREPMPEAA